MRSQLDMVFLLNACAVCLTVLSFCSADNVISEPVRLDDPSQQLEDSPQQPLGWQSGRGNLDTSNIRYVQVINQQPSNLQSDDQAKGDEDLKTDEQRWGGGWGRGWGGYGGYGGWGGYGGYGGYGRGWGGYGRGYGGYGGYGGYSGYGGYGRRYGSWGYYG